MTSGQLGEFWRLLVCSHDLVGELVVIDPGGLPQGVAEVHPMAPPMGHRTRGLLTIQLKAEGCSEGQKSTAHTIAQQENFA